MMMQARSELSGWILKKQVRHVVDMSQCQSETCWTDWHALRRLITTQSFMCHWQRGQICDESPSHPTDAVTSWELSRELAACCSIAQCAEFERRDVAQRAA